MPSLFYYDDYLIIFSCDLSKDRSAVSFLDQLVFGSMKMNILQLSVDQLPYARFFATCCSRWHTIRIGRLCQSNIRDHSGRVTEDSDMRPHHGGIDWACRLEGFQFEIVFMERQPFHEMTPCFRLETGQRFITEFFVCFQIHRSDGFK